MKQKRNYRYHAKEHIQWVRDNCKGKTPLIITNELNACFGLSLSEMQVRGILYNNKIKTGAYSFKPIPEGETDSTGRKIKIKCEKGNQEWQTLAGFLQVKELKKALKAKLKEVDKTSYRKRYKGGKKKYLLNDNTLVAKLMGGIKEITGGGKNNGK